MPVFKTTLFPTLSLNYLCNYSNGGIFTPFSSLVYFFFCVFFFFLSCNRQTCLYNFAVIWYYKHCSLFLPLSLNYFCNIFLFVFVESLPAGLFPFFHFTLYGSLTKTNIEHGIAWTLLITSVCLACFAILYCFFLLVFNNCCCYFVFVVVVVV